MVFIPLGLYTRIFCMPWITISLIVAIIYISFQNFDGIDKFEKNHLRSSHQKVILQKKLQLLSAICQQESLLNALTCQAVKKESTNSISSFMQPLHKIAQSLGQESADKSETQLELVKLQNLLFKDAWIKKYKAQLSRLPAYQEWITARNAYVKESTALFKKENLLSKGNISLTSVLNAQFIHANYTHLFGNLIFFLFLAIFVELRVGPVLFLMMYLLSGSVGLLSHILSLSDYAVPLMGASANISGIAGAFTVFFWRKRLKVFGTVLFVYNRVFSLPVYFFFPVLIFSGDLVGSLNRNQSGVAHLAHLTGFLMGAALAFIIHKRDQLPKSFYFEEELVKFQKAEKMPPELRDREYLSLLEINSENIFAHKKLLESFKENQSWDNLTSVQKSYALQQMNEYLGIEKKHPENFFFAIKSVHTDWSLKKLFQQLTGKELRKLFAEAEAQNNTHAAHILLQSLFERYPQFKSRPEWQRSSHAKSA